MLFCCYLNVAFCNLTLQYASSKITMLFSTFTSQSLRSILKSLFYLVIILIIYSSVFILSNHSFSYLFIYLFTCLLIWIIWWLISHSSKQSFIDLFIHSCIHFSIYFFEYSYSFVLTFVVFSFIDIYAQFLFSWCLPQHGKYWRSWELHFGNIIYISSFSRSPLHGLFILKFICASLLQFNVWQCNASFPSSRFQDAIPVTLS